MLKLTELNLAQIKLFRRDIKRAEYLDRLDTLHALDSVLAAISNYGDSQSLTKRIKQLSGYYENLNEKNRNYFERVHRQELFESCRRNFAVVEASL
jgi:hypothetical protein